jgi:hypothetical protein
MKSLVGIYQEQEQVDQYLDSIGVGHTDIVEVGPFSSRLQAMEWMEFMKQKIRNCELARCSTEYVNKTPWYGFTAVR